MLNNLFGGVFSGGTPSTAGAGASGLLGDPQSRMMLGAALINGGGPSLTPKSGFEGIPATLAVLQRNNMLQQDRQWQKEERDRKLKMLENQRAAVQSMGLNPDLPGPLLTAQFKAANPTATTYSKSPIYGTRGDETVIGAMGDDGSVKWLDSGDVNVSPGTRTIDTGTELLTVNNRDGQILKRVPKENYKKAFETKQGTLDAESQATTASELNSISSKMPGLYSTVDTLFDLSSTATYTIAGRVRDELRKQIGMEPTDAAVDRATYTAIVDNQILPLLRDTFGSQFTENEGKTLRATLGDPNASPAEKKAILNAFIKQKERDIAALATKAGVTNPLEPRPAPGNPDEDVDELIKRYGG